MYYWWLAFVCIYYISRAYNYLVEYPIEGTPSLDTGWSLGAMTSFFSLQAMIVQTQFLYVSDQELCMDISACDEPIQESVDTSTTRSPRIPEARTTVYRLWALVTRLQKCKFEQFHYASISGLFLLPVFELLTYVTFPNPANIVAFTIVKTQNIWPPH